MRLSDQAEFTVDACDINNSQGIDLNPRHSKEAGVIECQT